MIRNKKFTSIIIAIVGLVALNSVACSAASPGETDNQPTLTTSESASSNTSQSGPSSVASSSSSGPAQEAAQDPIPLRIAATFTDSVHYMALLQLAIDKGWFAENGLDASIVTASGGGSTMRMLTSDAADIAIAGPIGAYRSAETSGGAVRLIGSWFNTNIVYWVTTRDIELQGATLGTTGAGNTSELILQTVQAARPDLDLKSLEVPGLSAQFAAVQAGKLDGAYSAPPVADNQILNDGAHILLKSRDIVGDMPMNLVAVRGAYADENAESVRAFWETAQKAYEYVRDNPDAAAQDLARYIKLPQEVLTASVKDTPNFEKAWSINLECAALDSLSTAFVAGHVTPEPVDWAKVIDQQYLPAGTGCAE